LTGKEILQALRKKVPAKNFFRGRFSSSYQKVEEKEVPEFEGDVKKATKEKYSEIEGKRMSILVDNGFNVIRKVSNIDLIGTLKRSRKKVFAVIIDGAATKPIVKFCEDSGVSHIGAKNFSAMETDINLISL